MSAINKIFPRFVEGRGALGLLFIRVVVGAAFMFHGWGKIQHPFGWMGPDAPVPGIFQALAAVSEFGGGLAWILGLLTPLASFGIFCTMSVALFTHISRGDAFVTMGKPSFEPALVYFAVSTLLILLGPGRLSIDALIFGKAVKE